MTLWTALLVKAVTSALIVVLASVVAEAAGPFWGGLIISLPISAGPAYAMLALQHDAAFIAAGALASLAANAATFVLLTVIALLAPHFRRPAVMTGALAAWLVTLLLISTVHWSVVGALLLNIGLIVPATLLTRDTVRLSAPATGTLRRRWYELPARAALVGCVVASVVTLSRILGPSVTGMAAVFPVAFTSFAFLLLPRLGGLASAAVMAGAIRAMPGFTLALLVLHLVAEPFGTWAGLAAMVATSLLWSAGMMAVRAVAARRPLWPRTTATCDVGRGSGQETSHG
jgi:uncharacterized membrane protein (GlpM family)